VVKIWTLPTAALSNGRDPVSWAGEDAHGESSPNPR
jgi:hypothetical protein